MITEFTGIPEVGGPEKAASNENNQYFVEWVPIEKLSSMESVYPQELAKELANKLRSTHF